MVAEQKLWQVNIHYDAAHTDGTTGIDSSYNLIGKDQNEALQKARAIFSRQWEGTKELLKNGSYECQDVRLDNYTESVREYRRSVHIPRMDKTDSRKFRLFPRISNDGRNIEYLVD